MGDFRARDADRDRYVDVIEAAYVDGQLGDQDRELRVSRALVAETLDELEGLTRDLQNRPVPASPPPPTPVAPAPARPGVPGSVTAGKLLGVVAAALVGFGVVALLAAGQSAQQPSEYSVPTPRVMTGSPDFTMKPASVREFVGSYEARFGSLEPYEVTFFPRRVVAHVPLPGPSPRFEVWSWDGTWTQDADRAALDEPHARVDLGELDAGRLVDNIRTAKGALGVEQGRLGRAVLSRSGDDPAVVTIRITNQFNEVGSLTTAPSGEILGREPHAR
ncbi:DUF1707 domain-containing protein [Microvirga sp. 0TCS3.31]